MPRGEPRDRHSHSDMGAAEELCYMRRVLATVLLTIGFFVLAMAAMAVGVAVSGKRLAGSCGGNGGDSCRCGPEKRARCAEKAALRSTELEHRGHPDQDLKDDELASINPLAPPGEERLVQLSRREVCR